MNSTLGIGAVETRQARRVFVFNGVEHPDPGESLTPAQVRDILAVQHPQITTASLEGPHVMGDKLVYEFKRAVGTKG